VSSLISAIFFSPRSRTTQLLIFFTHKLNTQPTTFLLPTMSSIEEQFKSMPPITRGWFVAALLTTTAVTLGFADPRKLYLSWDLVINNFELWRLVTNFIFFGPFGMGFAFQLWIMCRMCYRYEENPFPVGTHINGGRSSADMMMMLSFGAVVCVTIGYLMGKPFMGPPLVFMVLYVWSRRNENEQMSIFGIKIGT
jgi:Derlin-2/3